MNWNKNKNIGRVQIILNEIRGGILTVKTTRIINKKFFCMLLN